MHKSVTFLLSGPGNYPVGGFKVVYEYSNRLVKRGWRVLIVHPAILWPKRLTFINKIRSIIGFLKKLVLKTYLPDKWFILDSRVKVKWTLTLDALWIPKGDIVVACPVESAYYLARYPEIKGRKYYFIQHFEDWCFTKEQVEKTWKYPLKKIVIAKWLKEIGDKLNQKCVYIPNGLDCSFYIVQRKYQERKMHSLCFLSHVHAFKGTKHMLEAARILFGKYTDLIITTFSVYPPPPAPPHYINYVFNPSQVELRSIYNNSAVFVSPSLSEGWGLTSSEAMLCGCAVVATDIGGHREFIEDGKNGLLCRPGDPDDIVEKVEFLFNNPEFARQIAEYAPQSLKRFDWESRTDLFEKALLSE